jgi:MoaA/NifB/PqqE/SkfB family radical SAM enzyme
MFKFNELKQIHLEITNNCQASCPMCSRNYHGGLKNPLIKIQEWSIDDFTKIINQEVLDQITSIYFCGNFGDPLLNDNLVEMCQYIKDNSDVSVRIHTNGSLRNKNWWKSLYSALPEEHLVIFGIDGLEDTHSIYRIGTDFNKIIENAKCFISAGGRAEWVFISFQHNEHQIEEARYLAKKYGFERFTVKNSSRFVGEKIFPVYDKNKNVINELRPPTGSIIKFLDKDALKNYREIVSNSEIDCYALKNKEIYIDAYKNLMPCCFLASIPYNYNPDNNVLFEIKQEILKQYNNLTADLKSINSLERSLKEIIDSSEYQLVWDQYWTTKKLITCVRTCGKNEFSKPIDQFVEKKILNG